MPIQSLGIFEKVYEWVYDKIIDPIVSWLGDILESMFSWILDEIIVPFIKPVFNLIWNILVVNLRDFFYLPIYKCYTDVLDMVDQLQSGFDILIGLKDITYIDSEGVKQQTTLLNYMIYNDTIRNVLISITFIALALSLMFAIYSVIRSTLDFDLEGKRPVGKVLKATAKTMMAFLFVPLVAWVGLNLSSILLKQTATAIMGGEDANISRWILAISSMDAVREETLDELMDSKTVPIYNESGELNEPFDLLINGEVGYGAFLIFIHASKIDYLVGFGSAIFAAIVMIICFFTFIRRIFDVILLYITSPYFSATIVLDDGEKFKRWRETFIAKIVSGFGSAIGMRIYLMIVPVIMSPNLQLFDSAMGEWAGGYIVRIIFLIGGMYAVHKSSSLLTSIISASVGAQESADNAIMGARVMSGAKKLAFATGGAFSKAFKEKKKNKFDGDSGSGSKKFDSGKFDDKFMSDLKETFGIEKDQFKEDYDPMSELRKNTGPFSPLQDADGIKGLEFNEDYTHEGDSKGNASTDGIASFDGADPIFNKTQTPDMSSVRKFKGEQFASGLASKTMSDDFEDRLKSAVDYTSPDANGIIDMRPKPQVIKTEDGSNMIEMQEVLDDSDDQPDSSDNSTAEKSASEIAASVGTVTSTATASSNSFSGEGSSGSTSSTADNTASGETVSTASAANAVAGNVVDPVKVQEVHKAERRNESDKF